MKKTNIHMKKKKMKTILDVHKIDGTNGNMAQWQKDDTRKKKMTTISKKKDDNNF